MKISFARMKVAPTLLVIAAKWLLRLLGWTQRVRFEDPHGFLGHDVPPQPTIFVIWHNRLLLACELAPRRFREKVVFLASRSRDGGYIADYLRRLGMQAVRGSSSRGGAQALLELRQHLEAGRLVALTPDGPRGPRYHVQDGVLWLARRTGAQIVPLAYNAMSHLEAKSWDRTHIPLPFSRGEYVVGEPIRLPPDLDEAGMDAARKLVWNGLMAISKHDHAPAERPHAD
jgi:lysophospholipid acyltransferase (LPLAT)-like uncharacterized protein